jgi:hypothetical protein
MEKAFAIAVISTVGAIATTISALLIIPEHGAWGAVWSRSAVQTLMVVITMVYISSVLKLPVPVTDIMKTVFAAAVAAASSGFLVWRLGNIRAVLAGIPLAACVYLFLARHLRLFHPDDIRPVERVMEKLPVSVVRYMRRLLLWLSPQE